MIFIDRQACLFETACQKMAASKFLRWLLRIFCVIIVAIGFFLVPTASQRCKRICGRIKEQEDAREIIRKNELEAGYVPNFNFKNCYYRDKSQIFFSFSQNYNVIQMYSICKATSTAACVLQIGGQRWYEGEDCKWVHS